MGNEKLINEVVELLKAMPADERKLFMFNANCTYLMESGFTQEQATTIAIIFNKFVMEFGDLEI